MMTDQHPRTPLARGSGPPSTDTPEPNEATSLLPRPHSPSANDSLPPRPPASPKYTTTATTTPTTPTKPTTIYSVLPTLLLGVFLAQADSSIVLATSQDIASRFHALSDAAWLVTSYSLAQCACQPLYGRTSDLFGRRPLLVLAYAVFAAGCALCGLAGSYGGVLAGRAVSGVGGAGMVGLVAVVVSDLVPPRDVARWRSYVNVVATLGRSCGGPLGGWLVDHVGWRWCFLGQAPVAVLAVGLIVWRLPARSAGAAACDGEGGDDRDGVVVAEESFKQQAMRLDLAGFVTLPAALITAFVALDFAGKFYSWYYIVPLAVAAVVLFVLFWYIEKYHAAEPIIPMDLISRKDVWVPYLVIGLQTSAQFIVVANMSVTAAGSRIVIIVVGNSLGGLVTGWMISRTGRYKMLIFIATSLGVTCYLLVLVRWNGRTSLADTWYLVLSGIGMGTTQNTTFVHLAAALDPKDMAVAGTSWFLSQNVGSLVAANVFNVVHNVALAGMLDTALDGVPEKKAIIEGCSSSVTYILTLPPRIREVVTRAFIKSLLPTNAFAFGCGLIAVVATFLIRERKLEK